MEKLPAGDVDASQHLQGLAGLPAELLDAVLRQLDASSRLPVFRTSKLLGTALLCVVPRIKLAYPTPHDIRGQHLRELAPFLAEVLQNRQQPKLHLTLHPEFGLVRAIQQSEEAEPAAAASDATRLVSWTLGAVQLCRAVDCLSISWCEGCDLPLEPEFSAALAASFPSLTSLTFQYGSISIGHMANAINHPLLLPRLLHLDLLECKISHQGELGSPPFIGSRLQKLSLHGWVEVDEEDEFLSGLLPLPPTLTQLEVRGSHAHQWNWARMAEIVSSLTQLQQLRLFDEWSEGCTTWSGYMALLPALAHLPSLHTLVMDDAAVGQEELDAFLALTQITSLKFSEFSGLTSSRASAACSWMQLEVHRMDWVTAAFLPLHSLTHPLHLYELEGDIEDLSIELLAAAELNLCERNKAGLVLDLGMDLSKATLDLLTEQYLTHSRHTAQQPTHPAVASSSSHSGPSTSLPSSSSPEGHITPGVQGSSSGVGGQQGVLAAGGQVLMQRLSHCVKAVYIRVPGPGEKHMSQANQQALAVLFPTAYIGFSWPWWIPA